MSCKNVHSKIFAYSMLDCKCKSKSRFSKLYCINCLYHILLLLLFFFFLCLPVNSECKYHSVSSFIICYFIYTVYCYWCHDGLKLCSSSKCFPIAECFFFLNALIVGGSTCNRYDLCHTIRRRRPVELVTDLGLIDS